MIPTLYDKTGNVRLGELTNCIECLVEEERNGLFEVSLIYPSDDTLFNSLEEENIIVCNANDTLLNQKFRIYMTRKLMSNKIEVFARHISFDLAHDYINNINIENQSCEYALNTIFRSSQFSTHYKGYSDIINAQDYKISKVNCIEAIGGSKGSILDTFGTGAEILRDNTNIHVLNKRGHDNGVSIEYAKNLTGFELEEDYSELITRIIPFATYSNSETNEDILVEANAVDSDLITNYSHPYISYMDFSDKFGDEEIPTTSKLTELAKKYFKDNNCDKPKQNFKIEFVPLSKCVGYEGIQDNISLCDTVTIKDTRYNIDTKAKVVRTVFNVLRNRYESMELGEPRTTLGDIINSSGNGEDGEPGPPGPQGPPGADGSIGDFPNSLPSTPVLSANVYGFASIELNWTYENKVYYNYELYGSKIKDFTPNTFDLIHAGQTSSYLFQAKPNETWYFRVRATNTHGESTNFSSQIVVNTTKIDDLSNYVSDMAIGDALIDTLNLGRGWYGELRGNYIDAKQLSVTDGNGKRTLDIDSHGNIYGDFTSLSFNNVNVEENIVNKGNMISNSNVLYTLDGFEAIGGSIKRYENIKVEEKPSDVPTNNKPTVDGETNNPGSLPSGGTPGDIIENPVITPPTTPPITGINRTRIHFLLTVSCGDCILIQTDSGKNILIDSVDNKLYDEPYPDAITPITNYLDSLGVAKIDYLICTHFHSDHAGGLDVIMNKYCDKSTRFFYKPIDLAKLRTNSKEVKWKTEEYYNTCLKACEDKGVTKVNLATVTKENIDSNTDFTVYYKPSDDSYNNYNEHSLVVVFRYKNKKVALMGDATTQVQYNLKDYIGKVDIVKDAHHGYNSTVDVDFIKTADPKDVIVTRNYSFGTDKSRACNSVGMWQSYNKNIYATFNSNNHIVVDFINNDYVINTTKKFYFENCWLKFNNDSSKWCYFKSGGNYAVNETLVLDGKKYNFNSSGFCTNPY